MLSFAQVFRTKPLRVVRAEENAQDLPRTLSLFDLVCIGVGGTVGSGIFAIVGDIISGVAGPSAVISWAVAGMLCILNAFAYMELVTRVPSSGSTYAYAYHALGELPAVIAASLLTLEYGMSGAGVARSWATKMEKWLNEDYPGTDFGWLNMRYTNILAAAVMMLCVVVLLMGVRFGKLFVNTMTIIKLAVVLFIIVAGAVVMDSDNLTPFVPPRDHSASAYGWPGIVSGTSLAFFGYIGFDEVCCLAAEAKNPRTTMPLAVLSAVVVTMVLSVFSSLVLSGMADYHQATSFPVGFRVQGAEWAAKIVHAGETLTMPVVVLIAFLAQPRLNYALACDGLLPRIFARVDRNGNLFVNTLFSGVIFIAISFVAPFDTLWDIVDFGILLNFVMGQCSLLMVRTRKLSPRTAPLSIGFLVCTALVSTFIYQMGYVEVASEDRSDAVLAIAIVFLAACLFSCLYIACYCPQEMNEPEIYWAPLVPLLPTISIIADFYMMAQLSTLGLVLSLGWLAIAVAWYFLYGFHNSEARTDWSSLLHYQPQLSPNFAPMKDDLLTYDTSRLSLTSAILELHNSELLSPSTRGKHMTELLSPAAARAKPASELLSPSTRAKLQTVNALNPL